MRLIVGKSWRADTEDTTEFVFSPCIGKERYRSQKLADLDLARIQSVVARGGYDHKMPIRSYLCDGPNQPCFGYHLTSMPLAQSVTREPAREDKP